MLRSLKSLFWKVFRAKPAPVESDEELARFIFSKTQITATGVKPAAFMPPPNFKYSIFRKSKMRLEEYLNTRTKVVAKRGKSGQSGSYKGTALITAKSVLANKLIISPEESDHKWHADIIGWPTGTEEDVKARLKELALALALDARVDKS